MQITDVFYLGLEDLKLNGGGEGGGMMKECPLFHKKPIGCISMLLFTILGTEEQQIEFF